jgi:hypothetical protein
MKTFTFDLTEPIEYSSGGELVSGTSITLYAPKPSQRKKAMHLKQIFFQAMSEAAEDAKPNDDNADKKVPEIEGGMLLVIIAQSKADYVEFIETGRSLICDKNAKINDAEYLTTVTMDKMDLDDMENLVGQYVANFIVKSALRALGKS